MIKNIILKSLVGIFLLSGNLFAYDYHIKKGWNQLGTMSNISDLSVFNEEGCVDYIWRYDNSKDKPIWKLHIANNVNYIYSGEKLESLKPTEGFWLKANSDCTITVNTPDSPPTPPELIPQYASSCKEILDAGKSIGDGIYTIDPDGKDGIEAFEAYCDMTTDGGGWTLVVQQSTNGKSIAFDGKDSNFNQCLLNTNKDCTQLSFLSKQIKGTSYMKQIGNGEPLVVKFNDNKQRTWWDMSANFTKAQHDANFLSTYFASNPNVKFKGFSGDGSSASGCQDIATHVFAGYENFDYRGAFTHSNGNTPCQGNIYVISNRGYKNVGYGARNGDYYKYGFVYVK